MKITKKSLRLMLTAYVKHHNRSTNFTDGTDHLAEDAIMKIEDYLWEVITEGND